MQIKLQVVVFYLTEICRQRNGGQVVFWGVFSVFQDMIFCRVFRRWMQIILSFQRGCWGFWVICCSGRVWICCWLLLSLLGSLSFSFGSLLSKEDRVLIRVQGVFVRRRQQKGCGFGVWVFFVGGFVGRVGFLDVKCCFFFS